MGTALQTLTKIPQYRLSGFSTVSSDGSVFTHVLRDSYLTSVNQTVNDVSNAFYREEVVATVETRCSSSYYKGPAQGLFTNTSIAFDQFYSPDFAGLSIYDATYEVLSANMLRVESSLAQPSCNTAGQCEPFLLSAPVEGSCRHLC